MQRLRWTISSAHACIGRCSSRPPAVIQARLLIPCDGILRRGRLVPAKEQADAAIVCLRPRSAPHAGVIVAGDGYVTPCR